MEPVIQARRASECVSLPSPATAAGLLGKQYPASICSGWSKSEFRVANTHSLARRACIVVRSGPLLHIGGKTRNQELQRKRHRNRSFMKSVRELHRWSLQPLQTVFLREG
jgi:hypothetical protein